MDTNLSDDDNLLADRVDIEPPIFKGCSSSELLGLVIIAIVIWIPLSVLIGLLLGKLVLALGIITVGVLGTVFLGAGAFQRIKRNRPDHFYMHAARRFLHIRKIWTSPFILRSGPWDIGRK